MTNKFKFNDKQHNVVKKVEEDKSQKIKIKSDMTDNNYEKGSDNGSDQDNSIFKRNFKSDDSDDDKKVLLME